MIIAKSITHFVKYEQLKIQNHFLEMLTATVSHEMRTPLNAIIGMGKTIEKSLKNDIAKQCHRISINSARLLLSIIHDLVDLFSI